MASEGKVLVSWRQALRLSYCLFQLRYTVKPDGTRYSIPGYLRRFKVIHWDDFLTRDIRGMAAEQIKSSSCFVCNSSLPKNTTGDHLVAKSKSGPDRADNWVALCRSCNSSKGSKDLMEWWSVKERSLDDLPDGPFCMYARLQYSMLEEQSELDALAPEYLLALLRQELRQYQTHERKAIFDSMGGLGCQPQMMP